MEKSFKNNNLKLKLSEICTWKEYFCHLASIPPCLLDSAHKPVMNYVICYKITSFSWEMLILTTQRFAVKLKVSKQILETFSETNNSLIADVK